MFQMTNIERKERKKKDYYDENKKKSIIEYEVSGLRTAKVAFASGHLTYFKRFFCI